MGGPVVDAGATAVVTGTFVEVFGTVPDGAKVDEGLGWLAGMSSVGAWFDDSKNTGNKGPLKAGWFKE